MTFAYFSTLNDFGLTSCGLGGYLVQTHTQMFTKFIRWEYIYIWGKSKRNTSHYVLLASHSLHSNRSSLGYCDLTFNLIFLVICFADFYFLYPEPPMHAPSDFDHPGNSKLYFHVIKSLNYYILLCNFLLLEGNK